jgi:hypothetical protein
MLRGLGASITGVLLERVVSRPNPPNKGLGASRAGFGAEIVGSEDATSFSSAGFTSGVPKLKGAAVEADGALGFGAPKVNGRPLGAGVVEAATGGIEKKALDFEAS